MMEAWLQRIFQGCSFPTHGKDACDTTSQKSKFTIFAKNQLAKAGMWREKHGPKARLDFFLPSESAEPRVRQ